MDESHLDKLRPAPRLTRRASINISSLSSAHPPNFTRSAPLERYQAKTADELIVNQHLYYAPKADVRLPIVHKESSKQASKVSVPEKVNPDVSAIAPARQTLPVLPSPKSSTRSSISSSILEPNYGKDVKYNLDISAEWTHLLAIMKKLKGVIRAWARWQTETAHGSGYCYTEEFSGALLFEQKDSACVLMNDLRGCKVSLSPSSTTAIQVVSAKDPACYVILDPENSKDFTRWLAVLVSWSPLRAAGISSKLMRFRYPELDFPVKSADGKTVVRTIKVGQVEMWDPSLRRNRKAKQPQLAQNWLAASCLLKTNGELQVFPDVQSLMDSTLSDTSSRELYSNVRASLSTSNVSAPIVSKKASQLVFELSTIRKSAIQKADPSLTGRDNCIVIFLKTMSQTPPSQPNMPSGPNTQSSFSMHHHQHYGHHQPPTATAPTPTVIVSPIYLYFDSKTNFEVWFALLRSLSLPELYGPDTGNVADSFRQNRILDMRIIDAKIMWPRGPAMHVESTVQMKSVDTYVDILLNDKVRARTRVKYGTSKPFWREDFSFPDLPFLVNSIKLSLKQRNRKLKDLLSDSTIGEVRMLISDIQKDSDLERWVPIYNPARGYMGKTGEICVKLQVSEVTVLASSEYDRLLELLLDFSNRLTIEIAELTGDLKNLSTILLDIYQASGQATDWIIALAEQEIGEPDPVTPTSLPESKESTVPLPSSSLEISRVSQGPPTIRSVGSSGSGTSTAVGSPVSSNYSSRVATRSNSFDEGGEGTSSGASTLSPATLSPPGTISPNSPHNRSIDLLPPVNGGAVADANLLFRGNSLLTKSLDAHMRRIGQDYISDTLGPVVRQIVRENVYCEVDPTRLENPETVDEQWVRLDMYMNKVWDMIKVSAKNCPPSLRRIFHNIRLQIENRFGEFLMAASYSGVSGFIFLRFFCPAVLNPKLFGLLQDHPPAKAQRTLTLIAKGLQGLANRTHFGFKEPWMAPMNKFLNLHTHEVKDFIVEVSTWRTQVFSQDIVDSTESKAQGNDYQDDNETEANKRSLSLVPYQIPSTILARLPAAFRDGVPSLPFLIDRPACLAALANYWFEWYDKTVIARRAEDRAKEPTSNESDASSIASSSIEGMPDAYTDDSDDRYSSDEDESAMVEDVAEEEDEKPTFSRVRTAKQDDMPTGFRFSGALLEFHRECKRIREQVQKLRYKSSIPEIPSEVPDETWDYYVANFLDTSHFHFVHRGKFLKSLFTDSEIVDEDNHSYDRHSFERGDDDYSYFPYSQEKQQSSTPVHESSDQLRLKKEHSADTARSSASSNSEHMLKETGSVSGSSTESVGGAFSTSMSKGFGSISKKSKSLRLPPWRKFLGQSGKK